MIAQTAIFFFIETDSKCYITIRIISEINLLNLAYNVTGQLCAYRDLQHMLDVLVLTCKCV